jgi:hypothetical protein
MCTPLAKLAIGLSATMATGFYYLAAAPPGSAAIDVCGPLNNSSACVPDNSPSPQSPASVPDQVPTSPAASLRDPVPELPIVAPTASPSVIESAPPQIVEPAVPQLQVVPSEPPTIVDTVPPIVPSAPPTTLYDIPKLPPEDTLVIPQSTPPPVQSTVSVSPSPSSQLPNIYTNAPALRTTTIPEPGTVVALLLTGAGIICSGRKRNKQVGQQR